MIIYAKKIYAKIVNLFQIQIILMFLEMDAASKTGVDDVRDLN